MDRIDLQVWMRSVESSKIVRAKKAEPSEAVAARVLKARIAQKHRFAAEPIHTNAEMSNKQIERCCPLTKECLDTMDRIMTNMKLSMRAYWRIIKVARTIADLEGAADIKVAHLLEAASFRFLDRMGIDL